MFETMIKALILLAADGTCLEADAYPLGNYENASYIVIDDCVILDVDVTDRADPSMTEIVVGWESAHDGRPVMTPIIRGTWKAYPEESMVYTIEVSGDVPGRDF